MPDFAFELISKAVILFIFNGGIKMVPFFSFCFSMMVKFGSEFLYQEYFSKSKFDLLGMKLGIKKALCILAKHTSVAFTFMHHPPVSNCCQDIGLLLPRT